MKVGIVGAGICGLSAARNLNKSGHEVVVFEKSATVGGRVTTHRQGEFVWDTGATSIAPRGKQIERVMLETLSTDGLIKIEKPIYTHTGLRISPGHPSGATRYTYSEGIAVFAKRLAEGLDVRLDHHVDGIERLSTGYKVLGEEFDALILTPPVPLASMLLWSIDENRPMTHVKYRHCLSILLGYDTPLPLTSYHALLDKDQVHPMTWLCLESVKAPHRAPAGSSAMSAQLSASYSLSQFERDDESLVDTTTGFVERLYGRAFQSPVSWSVVRWKYSQPESLASFENVNPKGSKLLIASDGLGGGHIEDAFDIGTRAAEQLVEED